MQSSYKKIEDGIELVDELNKDESITNLLSLSVSKMFVPSVANIIGSDMANYKIIRKMIKCSNCRRMKDYTSIKDLVIDKKIEKIK